jgi:hypothetical protein
MFADSELSIAVEVCAIACCDCPVRLPSSPMLCAAPRLQEAPRSENNKRSQPIAISAAAASTSKGSGRQQRKSGGRSSTDAQDRDEEAEEFQKHVKAGSIREVEVKTAADPLATDVPLDLKLREHKALVRVSMLCSPSVCSTAVCAGQTQAVCGRF